MCIQYKLWALHINKITEPIYLVHIAHVLSASLVIRFRRESLIQDQCKLCKRKLKSINLTANQIEIRKWNWIHGEQLFWDYLVSSCGERMLLKIENSISNKGLACILKAYMQNINTYSIVYDDRLFSYAQNTNTCSIVYDDINYFKVVWNTLGYQ